MPHRLQNNDSSCYDHVVGLSLRCISVCVSGSVYT